METILALAVLAVAATGLTAAIACLVDALLD